jgi:hypothetical protein
MKIRPILAKNCYACHTQTAMGGLRLDSREAVLQGGKSGPAIIPGDPGQSLLIRAIHQTDDKYKMPPTGKLKPAEIDLLSAWVKDGAHFPARMAKLQTSKEYSITAEQRAFWSFQPIRKVDPPPVRNQKLIKTEIDKYVLAKLETEGLLPGAPADRRTLLRRIYFDLIGLPPTPAEAKEFLDDRSPQAWEKLVDRLLASPRYGERWGRYWLDIARYADDKLNSTQDDPYPNSFRYRNWVIDAFNRDLPYDKFVMAQIAGDLMPAKNATEYAAGTGFFALSPEMQDERVDALSKAFLGLTVACAQCHDHKFDPIPTKDFYSLQGILSSSELHELPLTTEEEVKSWNDRKKQVDVVEKRLKDFHDNQSRIIGEVLAARTAEFLMATVDAGAGKDVDAETLARWKKYTASQRLYHPFLNRWRELVAANATPEALRAEAHTVQELILAIHEEKKLVDDKNHVTLGVDPTRNDLSQTQLVAMDRDKTVFWRDLFERSISDAGGAFNYGSGIYYYGKGTIDRFLSGEWKRYLDSQNALLASLKKQLPEQYPLLQTLRDKEKPSDMKVWIRGDRNNQGEVAPRRFLSILANGERTPFHNGSGRLQLAEAITHPDNPLTARVIANRVWQYHFGRGIVNTPSNFGQLGERPTHPELLDYLASELRTNNWSLKRLHKMILMSATYQRSSAPLAANEAKDPDNRLYWRANVRRLDIEAMRDAMLAASGELDLTPGEKPLRLDDDQNRKRTVYGFIGRRKLDGMLALFDFPNPQATSEARMSTNVPPQRLFLMNSPFVEQRAKALAEHLKGESTARIREAYNILYSRDPDATEMKLGQEFLAQGTWIQYTRALLTANEFLFVN